MSPQIATADVVGREELLDFVRGRHHVVLVTTKRDGTVQLSPVTAGLDDEGRVVIATYPERAKTHNARRHPPVDVLVLSDDFGGAWVQLSGTAEVLDLPGRSSRSSSTSGPSPARRRLEPRCSARASR